MYYSAFGVTIIALDLTRRTSRSTKAYSNFSWMAVASEHHEEEVMAVYGDPFVFKIVTTCSFFNRAFTSLFYFEEFWLITSEDLLALKQFCSYICCFSSVIMFVNENNVRKHCCQKISTWFIRFQHIQVKKNKKTFLNRLIWAAVSIVFVIFTLLWTIILNPLVQSVSWREKGRGTKLSLARNLRPFPCLKSKKQQQQPHTPTYF